MCPRRMSNTKKEEYMQYYVPLSAFDEINYKTYTDKFIKPKPKYNRPRTASEFALRNFKQYENNYLQLRREMTKFYGQEKESMNKMLYFQWDKNLREQDKDKDKEKDRGKSSNVKGQMTVKQTAMWNFMPKKKPQRKSFRKLYRKQNRIMTM